MRLTFSTVRGTVAPFECTEVAFLFRVLIIYIMYFCCLFHFIQNFCGYFNFKFFLIFF
jgi:hypothetical protein